MMGYALLLHSSYWRAAMGQMFYGGRMGRMGVAQRNPSISRMRYPMDIRDLIRARLHQDKHGNPREGKNNRGD
jgi:hypothetical protein